MNAGKIAGMLLLLALPSVPVKSQATSASLDLDNGFNAIKLGASLNAYPAFTYPAAVDDMGAKGKTYQVTTGRLSAISDLELSGIFLVCIHDTIRKIIVVATESNGADLLSAMIEKYGMPNAQNLPVGTYTWKSEKVNLACEKTQASYKALFSDARFYLKQVQ